MEAETPERMKYHAHLQRHNHQNQHYSTIHPTQCSTHRSIKLKQKQLHNAMKGLWGPFKNGNRVAPLEPVLQRTSYTSGGGVASASKATKEECSSLAVHVEYSFRFSFFLFSFVLVVSIFYIPFLSLGPRKEKTPMVREVFYSGRDTFGRAWPSDIYSFGLSM
ncbi:unnamed protein product [Lupinus luteus]|uniref:Transmembrane protein n=1 Tax=Lupinus luteus TaxID=3873 RepID=A0AAV1XIH3_LUPLU